jgi:site-specific DNA-methyltransferase (adenine-specific)
LVVSLELNIIFYEDCIEGIPKRIPPNYIDLVIADPPFGIKFVGLNALYNRKKEFVIDGYNEITKDNYDDFSKKWIKAIYPVLKESGSAYIFSGWTHLKDVLIAIDEAGFITINHLIWKYQFGVFTKHKYVTSHYHILFVVKNPKEYYFNKIDHYPEDVFEIKREYMRHKKKNTTKLPDELVEKLMRYSSKPGDIVLDPFMGNGTTAVVSTKLNRNYIGFEINPQAKEIIDDNIAKAKKSKKM